MKGLNKIALVAAIAAAPLAANAELTALNDSTMSNLTGQAGVTIELSTKVDIGNIVYTDEGSLDISAVSIGGADFGTNTVAGNLDDIQAVIDIDAAGNATIVVHNAASATTPIDFGVSVGAVTLTDNAGANPLTLASNISMVGNLAALNITVGANAGSTVGLTADSSNTLIATVGFSIENMDMDVDFLGMGIRGLSVLGANADGSTGAAAAPTDHFAFLTAVVGKGTSTSGVADALSVGINNFSADVNINSIELGGTSIGSVKMNDLAITNTQMYVFGH